MRRHDWPSRLDAVIKAKQRGQFQWGVNDCSLFACACIEAVTGIDPAVELRGKYDSFLSGARLVRELTDGRDLGALADAMAEKLGFIEIKTAFAQRGDLGLYKDSALGDTLGINIGKHFAFLMESGMTYLPTDQMAKVWRVG